MLFKTHVVKCNWHTTQTAKLESVANSAVLVAPMWVNSQSYFANLCLTTLNSAAFKFSIILEEVNPGVLVAYFVTHLCVSLPVFNLAFRFLLLTTSSKWFASCGMYFIFLVSKFILTGGLWYLHPGSVFFVDDVTDYFVFLFFHSLAMFL